MPPPSTTPLDRQQPRFPLFPIEGWKGKLRMGQRVPVAGLNQTKVEDLEGTTYGAWALAAPEKKPLCSDYVYYDTALDGGDLIVIWTPPVWTAAELTTLTESARAKGRLLRRYHVSKQHGFPAVLHDLQIEYSASGSVPRRNYQEDVAVSVPVEVSEYVTDVATSRWRVRCNEPIPGEVRGTFNGVEVYFPSCLHPRVEVTSRPRPGMQLIDCTPDRKGPIPGETRIFTATNHESLVAHVYLLEVREDGGLYFIREHKVYPPGGIPEVES